MYTKVSFTYLAYGIIIGLTFPLIAASVLSFQIHHSISFQTLITVQFNNPLLWIIDTIPIIIGLLAFKVGLNQEKINEINNNLEKKIANQTKGITEINKKLKLEITNREDKEQQLIQAIEDAYQGVKTKDQFLSNMSHEIRTPMNGIIGMTNLLLNTSLSKLQHKYLSAIDYSSKNLLVIINDILDLSKINSGGLTIEKTNFNIRKAIDSISKTLEIKCNEKKIDLIVKVDHRIPETLCGDPVRINQVLLNIVGNAVKFTEKGSVTISCNLQNKSNQGFNIAFEIIDTGIGIKKENIDNVFEIFTQANSTITRKYGGTGLGLPIAKKLIELQGGMINIESELGKGTTFYFTLQLDHPIKEFKKPILKDFIKISKEQKSKIKILLAEDNKINQVIASRYLTQFGFNSDLAEDGKEVLEMVEKNKYDLILMDVQMPELDGLQATRIIKSKQKYKNTKIMAMTSSVLKNEVESCFDAGMDEFISKPFDPDELHEKIIQLTYNSILELS